MRTKQAVSIIKKIVDEIGIQYPMRAGGQRAAGSTDPGITTISRLPHFTSLHKKIGA